jgi:Pyruvate phosphate dikinase, AMP/ATP-binding domain
VAGSRRHARYERVFFGSGHRAMRIGDGEVGGKAAGLLRIRDVLDANLERLSRPGLRVGIPTMTVVTTSLFDAFVERNRLAGTIASDLPDDRMAHAFQKADLPVELVGDLRALTEEVRTPLAIRSSSLLEDSLARPFAGVYATKMIPNNQSDPSERFRTLVSAVKLVYASTFFRDAKTYRRRTGVGDTDEKMAVVIQEVVGRTHGDRFYPDLSGVARSYNFYPVGSVPRDEGVVDLALGLGKTIVDGGLSWTYSPARPQAPPPFASPGDLLKNTQTTFWAVRMGGAPAYDPIRETEYLEEGDLARAERDGTLRLAASTYVAASDRLVPGTGTDGPRALNFAPLLELREWPLNDVLRDLLAIGSGALGAAVEIEFAATFDEGEAEPLRLALLQIRPMAVPETEVHLAPDDLDDADVFVASDRVMGNGESEEIRHVVFVDPDVYDPANHVVIAQELEEVNARFLRSGEEYLLVGFGRWGSSDRWLGAPVTWGQISAARAIVEVSLPSLPGDLSQGSHFFHNMTSFGVPYFTVRHDGGARIDWDWLKGLPTVSKTANLRQVTLPRPLRVQVDGRTGRGRIRRPAAG